MARAGNGAWILVGVGAAFLLFSGRKQIAREARLIVDAAKKDVFRRVISPAAQPYSDTILRVAGETGEDPFVLVGIGERESAWGTALALDVQGPGGTGDFTARAGSWTTLPGVALYDTLPDGWYRPADKTKPGPYAIPEDGRGWGRGLMQIDYHASIGIDWADPYANLTTGARILREKRARVAKLTGLTGDALAAAAIAAYNTGEGNVSRSVNARPPRSPDSTTTGRNYSADVLGRAATLAQRFVQAVA